MRNNYTNKETQQSFIGKVFNTLEVREIIPKTKGNKNGVQVKCVCLKCETDSVISISDLVRGEKDRCSSCSRIPHLSGKDRPSFEDISGHKFGQLLVKSLATPKNNRQWWLCVCDCGNLYTVRNDLIRNGTRTHCDNRKAHHSNKYSTSWKGFEEIPLTLWNRIKRQAKERGLEFNINIEFAWNLFLKQKRRCALSGVLLEFTSTAKKPGTASLDRIDSTKGYTENNIQWVHKTINKMKMGRNQENFINLCKIITEYQKGTK